MGRAYHRRESRSTATSTAPVVVRTAAAGAAAVGVGEAVAAGIVGVPGSVGIVAGGVAVGVTRVPGGVPRVSRIHRDGGGSRSDDEGDEEKDTRNQGSIRHMVHRHPIDPGGDEPVLVT